jgi:transcriptional regulator with XRE-family HTH domain
MSSGGSPAVDGALLVSQLRSLRIARHERQEDVAKALEWSLSKLIRVEAGRVRISKSDLEALLRHYEVQDEDLISRLITLARNARATAWWDKYKIPDKVYSAYVGYEASARSIRMSQGLLIPGLLQTEAYARCVTAVYATPEEVEDIVSLRLARQQAVFERGAEQYHILDEAVIRRPVGGARIMTEQLRHLLKVSRRPEVSICVIPFGAGPHFGLRGPFTLLGFDVELDDVLYLESARRGDLMFSTPGSTLISEATSGEAVARMDEIAIYQDGFESLMTIALSPDESASFIELVLQEF